MIQPEIALLIWVPIGALLMIDRNAARGYSIAVLAGLLLLPAGVSVDAVGVPSLTKSASIGIGVLAGTLAFHPRLVLRFRPRWFDGLLIVMLAGMVITSVANQLGAYDGLSAAAAETLEYLLLMIAARIVLSRPEALKTFLMGTVLAAAAYTPLVVWEWRISPQIHQALYGYFQHQFAQFHRWGFFRPVVCFPHALDLGRFMAFAAFIGALPLRREMGRLLPGGQWLFLAPLLSLALSMSLGPYVLFAGLCSIYVVLRMSQRSWPVFLLPAAALVMVIMLVSGSDPYDRVFNAVRAIDTERADSFRYRIDALDEYQSVILEQPWLGHGGWSRGRLSHRATDAELLIRALKFGVIGAGLFFAWWGCTLVVATSAMRTVRGARFEALACALAASISMGIAFSTVDRALDPHILVAVSGLIAIETLIRSGKLAPLPVNRVTDAAPRGGKSSTSASTA